MITIIVGNTKCKLMNLTDAKIIKEFDHKMSYMVQGYNFMNRNHNWDGRHRLFTKNHYFPAGLLSLAESILKKNGYEYQIQDNRERLIYGEPLAIDPKANFVARDYQNEAVNLAWKCGGGIIRMATGSGKTSTLSMITGKFNIKTIIYVIGVELLYQMQETIQRLYPTIKVGMVGDGHCEIEQITIMTIWSAANAFNKKVDALESDLTLFSQKKDKLSLLNKQKIQKAVREAELFILDECQIAGSETVKLLHQESISARHRFLLSGTPYRSDGADILIEAVGGPKFFNLDASTLIDQGWLVAPRIYFVNVPSKRNIGSSYQEIYKNYISENEERNTLIVKYAKKLVKDGRKVLILVNQVAHGKRLLSLLENDLRVCSLDGKNKSEDRMQAIQDMKEGRLDCILASKIFDQGVDIVNLDALILAGSGLGGGRALQRIGRVIRPAPGKKDAIVVDFIDNCKYLKDHTASRRKIFATESRFKIVMPNNITIEKEKEKKKEESWT